MLSDSFGRIATDLRVSLTDRCNLRCAYCMPPEGLDWLPAPDQLTDDEVVRLIRIGVERQSQRVPDGMRQHARSRPAERCIDHGLSAADVGTDRQERHRRRRARRVNAIPGRP